MIMIDLGLDEGSGPSTIARRLIADGADPEDTMRLMRCGAQCFPDHPLKRWAGGAVPVPEAADDYPEIVARLNDKWRVIRCRNGIQWIVQRKGSKWSGVSYCQTREALMRVSQEAGPVDPAAWEALAALSDHITARGGRSSRAARRKP